MDDAENKTPVQEESNAGEAAREAANELRAGAAQTLNEVKGIRIKDLFSFDKLIFPRIAQILFVLYVVLAVLFLGISLIGAVVALVKGQIGSAVAALIGSVISTLFMLIFGRIWIEVVLVAFKINEGVQDIKQILKNK